MRRKGGLAPMLGLNQAVLHYDVFCILLCSWLCIEYSADIISELNVDKWYRNHKLREIKGVKFGHNTLEAGQMKLGRTYDVSLVLSYTQIAQMLLSGSVSATTSNSTVSCVPELFANGFCDDSQNIEACGYDGGDCCECSCISTAEYACGESTDFACVDPSDLCGEDDAIYTLPTSGYTSTYSCQTAYFSDGDCDESNNNENCGYDGGDCCECTCVSTDQYTCGGYACLDPSAPCVDDDDYTDPGYTSSLSCYTSWFSDGLCDAVNNNDNCGYDGGDCCECTCVNTTAYSCGIGGYSCVDPSASCVDDDDDENFTTSLSCIPSYLTDAYCDQANNNEDCGYDGGDCCSCTCVSSVVYTCGDENNGGFACVDPSAPCVDDDDVTSVPDDDFYSTSSECIPDYFSDGFCDSTNNKEQCGYDGGDCCPCTCVSTDYYTCGDGYDDGGYACLDPAASCVDDDVTTVPESEYSTDSGYTNTLPCSTGYYSDGYCDQINNNEDCGYDGGDCCECTCISTVLHTCGEESSSFFSCVDPEAPCVNDDDTTIVSYTDSETEDTSRPSDDDIIFLTSDDSSRTDGDDITVLSSDDVLANGDGTIPCFDDGVSDGTCDEDNNNEACGYDGGDCCICNCGSTSDFTCEDTGEFNCVDPSSPCANGNVEAGTKTTVGVSANAYDTRPGEESGDVGCGEYGCTPALSRDGITRTESRWACAQKLAPDGGLCQIEFTFEDPQDIMDVQVAVWVGEESSRTLEVAIDGGIIGEFDVYGGSTFNALGIEQAGVHTLTFTSVGLAENDWIGFVEVRFWVEP